MFCDDPVNLFLQYQVEIMTYENFVLQDISNRLIKITV